MYASSFCTFQCSLKCIFQKIKVIRVVCFQLVSYQRSVFTTICDCRSTTCSFVFPGKSQSSKKEKCGSKKVCVLVGAALSIPGSLATRRQEQQSLASRKGTFLHPVLLGGRTITKWLTHTQWPLAWIFVVCAHTDLFAAGCTSSSKPWNIFSWPFFFF